MTDEAEEVERMAREDAPRATREQLDEIQGLAMAARRFVSQIADAKAHLRYLEGEHDRVITKDLPAVMDRAGVQRILVAARHGHPAFEVSLKTMYSANIAAGWDALRRKEAFDWLEANGHGSLIKTEVITKFDRDDREAASAFIGYLEAEGHAFTERENVHPQTLSAWLKEMVTRRGEMPPLDTIGGYIERQAVIKTAQGD